MNFLKYFFKYFLINTITTCQVVSKFNAGDVEGVVRRANMTEYGLASGVFTKDINKALYVSETLDAGTCFVNM